MSTLRAAIIEVAYRVVSEVGASRNIIHAHSISTIAEAIADKIMEQVTFQGNTQFTITFQAVDLDTYELFCAILDGIQKEIPVVSRMNVTVSLSRLKGLRNATPTVDSGDGGDPSGLDA